MIFKVKDGQVAAMSETAEEAQVLLKLSRAKEAGDKAPTLVKKRGKYKKYATEEERKEAHRRYSRKWYRRNKAKKAAEALGTPVAITKVEG